MHATIVITGASAGVGRATAHYCARQGANVPEDLSSAAGMKKAGRLAAYVFGLWSGIALISGLAALIGYAVFAGFSLEIIAATEAVAAGSILAVIADTMIPETFEVAHDYAGLITVAGFLAAFTLSKLGG
jgi:ZIP family zinc transporter